MSERPAPQTDFKTKFFGYAERTHSKIAGITCLSGKKTGLELGYGGANARWEQKFFGSFF